MYIVHIIDTLNISLVSTIPDKMVAVLTPMFSSPELKAHKVSLQDGNPIGIRLSVRSHFQT